MSEAKKARTASEVYQLNGRSILWSLKRRTRDVHYLCCFTDAQGKRREVSTGHAAKSKARKEALKIIDRHYPGRKEPAWEVAIETLKENLKADGRRPGSIQQYLWAIANLRKVFPNSKGPADIESSEAHRFKLDRVKQGKSPRTVKNGLTNLSICYSHWITWEVLSGPNPFAKVSPPKADEKPIRVVTDEELDALVTWLSKQWDNWRLPRLFVETMAAIGCRISELAEVTTDRLEDGRIVFSAETTKGRKQRKCRLPSALYDELKSIAGPVYIWERFAAELRQRHEKRGNPQVAKIILDFAPGRLVDWMQDQCKAFIEKTETPRFTLHRLRARAMTKAWALGIKPESSAVAFGCEVNTMKKHYVDFDDTPEADAVFDKLASVNKT